MRDFSDYRSPLRQLVRPIALLMGIFGIGTVGYWLLGGGTWSWMDCAYMTVLTLSTVGFHEAVPIGADPLLRAYTISLILVGAGSMVYLLSNITAFVVEGELNEVIRRRRMDKRIERMQGHYVVCGVGRNGEHAAVQMHRGGHDLVVVDHSQEAIDAFLAMVDGEVPWVIGDAGDDAVLERAGIGRARGLIAALAADQDNLYLVLAARELNPTIRIVAKVNEQRSRKKMIQVGVQQVVSPSAMGGYRMYQEMVRPQVTDFMDYLLHESGEDLAMDEVPIGPGSRLAGQRLADSGIRTRTNVLVVGVRDGAGDAFTYNPGPDFVLAAGSTLIVIGRRVSVADLREMGQAAG